MDTAILGETVRNSFDDPGFGIFGRSYQVWLALQSGQEQVVRFSRFIANDGFGHRLRKQSGHDHACSISFLCMIFLMRMRPYVGLDELLITRACQLHDVPEGLLKRDIVAPCKTDLDDIDEYNAFRELFEPLGAGIWDEVHRCYLLQFALTRPKGLPEDAVQIADELMGNNRHEALFFEGLQRIDYLYYAYECRREHDVHVILAEVAKNQFHRLQEIADRLPGFSQVIWTPERKKFFRLCADSA